jgi:tRNA threonylcarbamoyladenosine biosynthesis protein TsaE
VEFLAQRAEETAALGESLAKALPGVRGHMAMRDRAQTRSIASSPPASPLVVYLSGDLGSGKTTFAQGFVRGCGISDAVRSPTYALLEPYELDGLTLLHLDLYRLQDAEELDTLGLRDWLISSSVWLIEWPEKGGARLPPPDVRAELSVQDAGHLIRLTGASAPGAQWLEALKNA